MTIPTISTLPVAPARTDAPATFVTRADAFLAAMVTMQGELNTSIGAMNTDIAGVNDNVTLASEWATKNDAAVSGTDWSAFANASGASPTGSAKAWATTASGVVVADGEYSAKSYASDSSDSAVAAAASATAAEAASSATLWVSGTSYTAGDVVYSPINYLSYRANTATSGTTDPSLSSDWTALVDASPKTQAVASGALANGDLVAINADGTVSVVAETTITDSVGSPTVFNTANSVYFSAVYDPNQQKVAVFYNDYGNSGYGTAIVGTVSGSSISFGTSVVFSSTTVGKISSVYDLNAQKIVLIYGVTSGTSGVAVVANITGSSITFGSSSSFATNNFHNSAVYDSDSQKIIIAYNNATASNIGEAVVGTVSGNTISFGTSSIFNNSQSTTFFAAYDSNAQKTVIVCRDNLNSAAGIAIVGTTSGTSISFSSPVVFNAAGISYALDILFDSNSNKIFIGYQDSGNSNYGTAIIGTVSGNSISFGSKVVFVNASASRISLSYDKNAEKVLINYNNANTTIDVITGTIEGSSVSLGSPIVIIASNALSIFSVYDEAAKKVVAIYRHDSNSNYGTAAVFTTGFTSVNLTAENYIGVSDAAYTDGATANIQVTGAVDDAQSGLTAGEAYYVQLDGTLATTPDTTAVFAGTALSATELLIGKSEPIESVSGTLAVDFVATGTLASGVTVALRADGTVEAVAGVTEGAGSPTVFNNAIAYSPSATYDSTNNKIVISYRDGGNSNYGTAIVGTVSGTSITFGSPVIFNNATTDYTTATYDSTSNKVVISYRDYGNSNYGTAIVGTVSGTSISFGSPVVFQSSITNYSQSTYDSTNNKVVIAWQDSGNSNYGTAIVGTVSGTSISFGTSVVFESANTAQISVTHDSTNNKIVIAYRDGGNSNYGTAVVGTVSGTSISFGTAVIFNSAGTNYNAAIYDSTNYKVVIAYRDDGNSNYGTAIVGTVSGTSISFGSPTVFESASLVWLTATYDSANGKVVISYKDGGNSDYGTAIVATVSGTSITFGSPVIFNNATTNYNAATYDSTNNKVVIAYRDDGNSNYATAVVFTVASSNNTDFIGITNQAIADTATGEVIVKGGVSDKLSGLTIDADYYVQSDGTLSTTVSSVPAGKALSATELLISTSQLGVTATATELNYVSGVTSAIQTQIDGKEPADATILKDADIGSTVLGYVAPSTSGNILTSNGSVWQSVAPAGGGAWELISATDLAGTSTVTLTSGISSDTYSQYKLVFSQARQSSTATPTIRFQRGGTTMTSRYNYYGLASNRASYSQSFNFTYSALYWGPPLDPAGAGFEIMVYAETKSLTYNGNIDYTISGATQITTGVHNDNSGSGRPLTGFYIQKAWTSGYLYLYGLKNS